MSQKVEDLVEQRTKDLLGAMIEFHQKVPIHEKRIPIIWISTLQTNMLVLRKILPNSPCIPPCEKIIAGRCLELPHRAFFS